MISGSGGSGADSLPEALGLSEAFLEFQEKLSDVAPIERPVLILGERGTGKELAASRIHFLSKRWQKPLVTLNCAALTRNLIGSELFGYEKGAFTGAGARQAGRFEKADKGTLFLDEIGTIPLEVQEKILRVVEYGRFERVGSSASIEVDVRIVAATNADLRQMAESGQFKQDLLDRLSFEVIYVPPLRDRRDDILYLANHFAARMAFELGRDDVSVISSAAARQLIGYDWPGNIRELKNVVERAVYQSKTNVISKIVFDPFESPYGRRLKKTRPAGGQQKAIADKDERKVVQGGSRILNLEAEKPFKEMILDAEAQLLGQAMQESRFNQKKAAAKLGLTYDQFRGLKKKHDSRR